MSMFIPSLTFLQSLYMQTTKEDTNDCAKVQSLNFEVGRFGPCLFSCLGTWQTWPHWIHELIRALTDFCSLSLSIDDQRKHSYTAKSPVYIVDHLKTGMDVFGCFVFVYSIVLASDTQQHSIHDLVHSFANLHSFDTPTEGQRGHNCNNIPPVCIVGHLRTRMTVFVFFAGGWLHANTFNIMWMPLQYCIVSFYCWPRQCLCLC